VEELGNQITIPPLVRVVPVRMMEAWLLQNESAIRMAADNPNGRNALGLPSTRQVERIHDPKDVLRRLLIEASGLPGRRRKSFGTSWRVYRIAELIEDFSILDQIPAFARFTDELEATLTATGLLFEH
jgi:hypothetical protein